MAAQRGHGHAEFASESGQGGLLLLHDLRRTAVRNMIRAGVPKSVAKKINGHKTDAMFNRYNITSDDDLRAAAEAVGRRYEAPVSSL